MFTALQLMVRRAALHPLATRKGLLVSLRCGLHSNGKRPCAPPASGAPRASRQLSTATSSLWQSACSSAATCLAVMRMSWTPQSRGGALVLSRILHLRIQTRFTSIAQWIPVCQWLIVKLIFLQQKSLSQ